MNTLKKTVAVVLFAATQLIVVTPVLAAKPIDLFEAHPPIHVRGPMTPNRGGGSTTVVSTPTGMTPTQIKAAYNLSTSMTAGTGKTIAIVDAYDNPTIENDLKTFSQQFSLPLCTSQNGCFKKVLMAPRIKADQGWALEAALDVEWAHAIAPGAKILYVVAKSASGTDLLRAVDYARQNADIVSMSWGGNEFSGESSYDSYFTGATFFASSGDSGAGVSWPAVSPNVISVGGTTLTMSDNTVISETAWSGSGGGVSAYVAKPAFQAAISGTMRMVPDVSYNGDPNTGFPVYDSYGYEGVKGWFQVGGTSAGTPQWAAIHAVGSSVTPQNLYAAGPGTPAYASTFRDIISGSNGFAALTGFDLVTGLGSPLKYLF